ncbi:MAG: glucoamylase family protein [Pseudomonadota bacterium]
MPEGAGAAARLRNLSTYAREFLNAPPEFSEPAVRAELFGRHRFEEHGRSLAQAQPVLNDGAGGRTSFFPRVDANIAALRRAYDYTASMAKTGHYVTPAAEWLLDNFHLVEAQLLQIREGLPRHYYRSLPKLAVEHLRGLPRVYGICWAYVAHTDSVFNNELFSAFIQAYQEVSELRLSELWALPTTLRVVLLENLRRAADSIAHSKVARELAHAVWDKASEWLEPELEGLLVSMQQRHIQRAFLTQLWQRLPPDAPPDQPLVRWLSRHCPDGAALVAESQAAQVNANLTVSNIITMLRLIGQVDWVRTIEPLSHSLQELSRIASFADESDITRTQLTHAMERLAKRSGRSEREVAQRVVTAVIAERDRGASDPAVLTAGWHLLGPGRSALDKDLGIAASRRIPRRGPGRLTWYLLAIGIATGLLLWLVSHRVTPEGAVAWLALALLLFPASEAAGSLVHRLLAESLKIHVLPRLAFPDGIPAVHRTLVVMPSMLGSASSIRALAARLELHYLANREDNAQFALLTDWPDAPQASRADDAQQLALAVGEVAQLNARHPAPHGQAPRFLVLHRPRIFSETQQTWMGWERKRGKLEQLIRGLATGDFSGFAPLDGAFALNPQIRYVVTLDSDTGLPVGTLRELVSIAAHPLNEPRLDAIGSRVIEGHAILQPRIVTPLPDSAERTPYHLLFAGRCGIDPYSAATSDVYQDLFGTGSFIGKGLLHVQALHAVLDARVPPEAMLSHDLFEGTVARCAYVSDVALVEDHPNHVGVAASRIHRWIRGDWQLLPLMASAGRYGIDTLGFWKMADNLRRSLVAPTAVTLVALAVFGNVVALPTVLAVIVAALLAGPLMGALAGLIPTRRGFVWQHFFRVGGVELAKALGAAAWQFSQLASSARLNADAIVRALWRMAASRRQLLEWTTAEQAQASAQLDFPSFLKQERWTVLACVIAAFAATRGSYPVAGSLLFGLWALAPLGAWWASRPKASRPPLGEDEKRYLMALGRDTWSFFERCVTEQENHLPPDNLQMVPEPTIASRTSPTNIGLYLTAACCAHEFGWIGTRELAGRLDLTLSTIEGLPKHNGHLYNWYDTRSLAVLQPAYVSTVDSGNLAGLLITVAQSLRAVKTGGAPSAMGGELQRLALRCETLADAMNFRPLYSARRHLFHIGLRVAENELDAGYYDLLASESRLTSLLAIAKGDVPRQHWGALGRPFLTVGFLPGLKSWSGSMFEYLMPSLVMAEPEHGLLSVSARAAVQEHQAFGKASGLPWGISESAYFAQDHSLAYQYGPFGVPRLALRRTPPTDRVIAPYATLMAAMFDPQGAVANLRALEKLGGRGELGMYEAIDFTTQRQVKEGDHTVVQTFMAHHHGMAIVALCNLLCEQAPRRWFSASPQIRAHESLLHENTPRQVAQTPDPRALPQTLTDVRTDAVRTREINPDAGLPTPTQLLSNGRYSLMLRANGAGAARCNGQAITRWRDDLARDGYGTFLYLREIGTDTAAPLSELVSLTSIPAPGTGWRYRTRFLSDHVEYEARSARLASSMTVLVSPEDDTEVRSLVLTNLGAEELRLEVMTYGEAVLAPQRADEAHPAFSGMFVQASWNPQSRALSLSRRPRLEGDAVMSVAHVLALADAQVEQVGCMVDRRLFLGRNRNVSQPEVAGQPWTSEGPVDTGLDPIASIRLTIRIAPGAVARLCFVTLAAPSLEDLEPRIDRYLQPTQVQRAMRTASTLAQVRLRDLDLSPDVMGALQDMTTALAYAAPRPGRETGLVDQRVLWRLGISGDKPIVLVRIHLANGLPLVDSLLRAQSWWQFGGQGVDLVVLNGEPNAYLMPLQRDITALRDRLADKTQHSVGPYNPGAVFLLRDQDISGAEKATLTALARFVFNADGRPLDVQVATWHQAWAAQVGESQKQVQPTASPRPAAGAATADAPTTPMAPPAPAKGAFDAASGEFIFDLASGQRTPRPWVNVISNPSFGFQVSEVGSGFTWSGNSRLHQVTPWSNDPVRDTSSTHWLLHDRDSGAQLALTSGQGAGGNAHHRVRHGQGYTVITAQLDGLETELTFFAAMEQPVQLVQLRITNTGAATRRLRALACAEWELGDSLTQRRTLHTWRDETAPALYAQQREQRAGFGAGTAFLAVSGDQPVQWTCDRTELFDAAGRLAAPQQLMQRSGIVDPAAAIARDIDLSARQTTSMTFVLGHAADAAAAQSLALDWRNRYTERELAKVKSWWSDLLSAVQVSTPDPLFDAMVNRWLLYQTVTCRLWSKAGFYQAGGAFGYRDQLQDAMALAWSDPGRLRSQILLNASRQFPEGDVQHWWHAPGGEGVRTHFSDDLLWLPFATAHYLDTTGDASLLDESVEFIDGPPIPPGAEDAYYAPSASGQFATLFEHAARTIDKSLETGPHGLPLMGTGDWNDGMNRVGHAGRGESVWLGWFLCAVVEKFALVARARGEGDRARRWEEARLGWIAALHADGWDGQWFRRAFFDNGAPLGSSANAECRIDLIAQAWSVLSGASTPEFTRQAMASMDRELLDRDAGLLHLLHPPLQNATNNPGYIQAYPPGVRENGGQYSHAAVWALMAQAQQGDVEGAWRSFAWLSPAHRSASESQAAAYELEPYVMPGDIYGSPPYTGRGGWSWYTGSAAWLYRAATETLLGITVEAGRISMAPRVPPAWDRFDVDLNLGGRKLRLAWRRQPTSDETGSAHRTVEAGEWLELHELPEGALVVVQG